MPLQCKDCGNFHDTSNVHCGQKPIQHPYVCPICHGTSQVPAGFYSMNLDGVWSGTSAGTYEPCRSCHKGVIWR